MEYNRAIILSLALILIFSTASAGSGEDKTEKYFKKNKKMYIVTFEEGTNTNIVEEYGEILYEFNLVNAVVVRLSENKVEQLSREEGIESIEEDKPFYIGPSSRKPKQNKEKRTREFGTMTSYASNNTGQWNLGEEGINAEAAWEQFFSEAEASGMGDSVKIAILDSGVNYNLPDLNHNGTQYLGGRDFCANNNCKWVIKEDKYPMDEYGHGTEMASAMLGAGGTIAGVAPNTQYYAIRIADNQGNSSYFTLRAGLDWTLSNKDPDIIYIGGEANFLGWGLGQLIAQADRTGILVVAPTYKGLTYPSFYPGVFSVGAHTRYPQDINTDTGDYAEVLGPGEEVPVLGLTGNETTAPDSISVAAAQVAGALALMIDYNNSHGKDYNSHAIWTTFNQSAIDLWLGDPQAGNGKADINAALTLMANDWSNIQYTVNYIAPPGGYDRDGYPIYYFGRPMTFQITATNISDKPIENLAITSQNFGGWGTGENTPFPGVDPFTDVLGTLAKTGETGDSVTGVIHTFTVPYSPDLIGLDSTRIIQIALYDIEPGMEIAVDREAGVFCPPEVTPEYGDTIEVLPEGTAMVQSTSGEETLSGFRTGSFRIMKAPERPEYESTNEREFYEEEPRFIMESDTDPTDVLLGEIETTELTSDEDNFSEPMEDGFRIMRAPE